MEAFLLAPPLPSVVSVLILLGVGALAEALALWLRGRASAPLDFAASFVLVTALLCALLHGITWLGLRHLLWVVRLVGWGLAILGLIASYQLVSVARAKGGRGLQWYRRQGLYVRLAMTLAAVTLVGYLAAALGPATDVDSLDYHLGVPLDWLLHGGAYPRPDWLHARLVGLGEMVNMLGLAAGTDSLGAVFQFGGLLVAAVAVDTFAEGVRDRVLGILLVVSCPVMLSLVSIQKPELLPAAATSVALVMLVDRWGQLDISTMVLAFGCVAFAMACKYSFLLTGFIVFVVGLMAAQISRRVPSALAFAALALVVLVVPVWARNLAFYHDPISPLLERFKPTGDPFVVGFAHMLRGWPGEVSIRRLLLLPWQLTATARPGEVSTILGLGTFAFILALRNGRARVLLLAATGATLLIVGVCQLTPRFFLEPYLWCAAAAVGRPDSSFKSVMRSGLLAQTGIVAALALFLGVRLFPGALTRGLRDHTMSVTADGYQAAKWLNTTLPADAVVLTTLRAHALLRRRFVVLDTLYTSFLPLPADLRKQRLLRLLDANQPTLEVVPYPFPTTYFPGLAACSGTRLYGPATFRARTRNPLSRGTYALQVVRLELNGRACANSE